MLHKKAILVGLVGLVSLGLAACGSKTSDGTTPNTNSGQKAKISIWAMGEEGKKMEELIQPFNEQTGTETEVQVIPWGEAHTKLLTAVASKTGPDVIQLGTTWMPEFVEAGALTDLTPFTEKFDNLKPDNFFEGSNLTTTYDGKTYGIPLFTDTRLLYYRTDILESVGYTAPPKTWEEMKEVSAKLKARGADFYGMNWDLKEQSLIFMLANQLGANYYGTDYGTDYNTPEFKGAVEYILPFLQNGESLMDPSIETVQGFTGDGLLPMFISGPWMINVVNENAPEIEGKWATAVLPKGSANNDSILGGTNLTVFAYSKNIDPSVAFINFMADKESQSNWFKSTSTLPAVKAAWDINTELKENALYVPFGEQLQHAKPMPLSPKFEEIAQAWILDFEKIYRGGADVQTTVEEFNANAQKIYAN